MSTENANAGAWIAPAVSTAGGLLGMLGQRKREKRAVKNQMKLMDVQLQNQKELNEQGHDIQMQMWKDTNYPAQIAMLKEAGMNPSLLYGMKGGGGITTGSQGGGSAAGGQAPAPQPMEIGNYIQQAAMTKAQIDLLKSQTKKNEAEATKTAGVDTETAETNIKKLITETENEKTKGQLMNIEKDIIEIDKKYKEYQILNDIDKITEETTKLRLENSITEQAMDDILSEIKGRAIGQWLNNNLTEEKTNLTKHEVWEIKNEISQKWAKVSQDWKGLTLEERNTKVKEFEAMIKADYPGTSQVIGAGLEQFIRTIDEIIGTQRDRYNKRPK